MSILMILVIVVIFGAVMGVVLLASKNKHQNRKRVSKRPIVILAVISVFLSLLSGFNTEPHSIYSNFGLPFVLIQFASSVLFLVFCIFVDKKPELTVIPKCLLVADYASYFIHCLINAYYPMRVLLRDTMFDIIDLLLPNRHICAVVFINGEV